MTAIVLIQKPPKHHPNFKHGFGGKRLSRIFTDMKRRCYNPEKRGYKNYGGKGITIASEWLNNRATFYRSGAYAMEELRAELSSAFLSAELGIPSEITGHASYIQSWLKPLKDDKREIFRAAADAQKIVDMVLNLHPDFASRQPEQHLQSVGPSREETGQRTASAYRSPAAAPV